MRIAVVGASGRMGCAVVRIARALSMDVVCAVASTGVGRDIGDLAGVGAIGVPVVETLQGLEGARTQTSLSIFPRRQPLRLSRRSRRGAASRS